MFQNERIEKRLTKSFILVSLITAVSAVVGLIALIVMVNRYSYALTNFGFAQGDIGKAMFEFADVRSSLRAAIGYDDQDAIDLVVQQHKESKAAFLENFAKIENTIVSKSGRETYDNIASTLDSYWELDDKIMNQGASVDREECRVAQEWAINEMAPAYNSIYEDLDSLLEVKVRDRKSVV